MKLCEVLKSYILKQLLKRPWPKSRCFNQKFVLVYKDHLLCGHVAQQKPVWLYCVRGKRGECDVAMVVQVLTDDQRLGQIRKLGVRFPNSVSYQVQVAMLEQSRINTTDTKTTTNQPASVGEVPQVQELQ